jgi:hypothetical protein
MLPDDVKGAVDRMCTPLDPSVLHGATAEADASCMAAIRAHLEAQEASNDTLRSAAQKTLRANIELRDRAEKAEAMLRMLLPYLDRPKFGEVIAIITAHLQEQEKERG